MNRDERQDLSLECVLANGGVGTVAGCTGYGKTHVALKYIKRLYKKYPDEYFFVIVPSIPLQEQWKDKLESLGYKNFNVFTIQAVTVHKNISKKYLSSKLVILDEIHLMIDGDHFGEVFNLIDRKGLLGLSGTLRIDQELKLKNICPVVDTIPVEVALKNGWVADFVEYNLYVELSDSERKHYNRVDSRFREIYPIFNNFMRILDCHVPFDRDDPKRGWIIGAKTHGERVVKRLKARLAEGTLDFNYSHIPDLLKDDKGFWLSGIALTRRIQDLAEEANSLSRERKDIIFNSKTCIDTAVEVIKYMKMKTITFGESTQAADIIASKLGKSASSYHSSLKTEVRTKVLKKEYKREKSAIDFYNKNFAVLESLERVGNVLTWNHPYKVGKKLLREEVLAKLRCDLISTVTSAKALDTGLDVSGMQLALMMPSDANREKYNQRRGRIIRKEGEKVGYVVNVIPRRTKAEEWIERAQMGNNKIRKILDISDLIFDNYG